MLDTTVAYIGLTHQHCKYYLESLTELPVRVTCACEPNGDADIYEEVAEHLGDIPIYDSTSELFESESVDMAWISLSNRATPPAIELAANHGVDVFAEKTLARRAADLKEVADIIKESGITVGVGYQNRALSPARELRKHVNNGYFGNIRGVELRMVTSQLSYRDLSDYVYHQQQSRGGILQWLGCHYIDMIQWMLDENITAVSARTSHWTEEVNVEDGAIAQFEMESGTLGTLQAGYYDREYDTYIGLHGSDGRGVWSATDTPAEKDRFQLESYDGSTTVQHQTTNYEYRSEPGYGGAPGYDYMQSFINLCQGNGEGGLVASVDDALQVLKVLDAAYKSAETDSWVSVQ